MLKYIGNDEYEIITNSGKELVLSKEDLIEIYEGTRDNNVIETEEDYEMMASENYHLAKWIKDRTGLSDEKVALIALTGTFATDAKGSEDVESDTTE